jgi:uncharacterized protein DUF6457
MSAKEWLAGFATLLGVDAPTAEEIRDLLALAGDAAHASERIAAPVACWLVARAGLSPGEARKRLEEWKANGKGVGEPVKKESENRRIGEPEVS